jgi:hypothetical protein
MTTRGFVSFAGVVAFTAVEALALGLWLGIVEGDVAPAVPAAVGLGVLFAGLVVEAVLTHATVNGTGLPAAGPTLALSATETALWAGWLAAADAVGGLAGVVAASAALFVLLVPQHTVEDNALRGDGLLSDAFDAGTLGFSFVEATAGAAWLALVRRGETILDGVGVAPPGAAVGGLPLAAEPGALVGVAALAALLFVEHVVAVDFARR